MGQEIKIKVHVKEPEERPKSKGEVLLEQITNRTHYERKEIKEQILKILNSII